MRGTVDVMHAAELHGQLLGDLWLASRPEAAGLARRFVRLVATTWQASHVPETAELLVSELVTNAVRHVGEDAPLCVLIARDNDVLRVEVHDSSRRLPRVRHAADDVEDGRGLFLAASLAKQLGSRRTANGKVVWFEPSAWPAADITS